MSHFSPLARHACALVSVALAIALRRGLDPWLGERFPYALPFLAVMVTAWVGGRRPAIVAVVLGCLGADWFLLPPRGSFDLTPEQQAGLGLFLLTGLGIALLGGSMHETRQRAEKGSRELVEANATLDARVQERTAQLAEANEALRAGETLLATVTGSIHVGLVIVDEQHRYRYANRAYCEILGLEGDLVGKLVADMIPAAYEAQIRSRLEQAFAGEVVSYELWLPALAGGAPRYYAVTYRPGIDRIGPHVVVVIVDISERKRTEDALAASEARLRQSQKLEAFGQLAGGVAHDFNNILGVILSCGELLALTLPPADEEARQLIEGISDASQRGATLTRQLLAFTRQQVLAPRVLEVNGVIREVEKMLRRLIGEDIRLVSRLDPAAGKALVDPGQLEQVIMNLALNARDAMPQGGELTITTDQAQLGRELAAANPDILPGAFVRISLRDNGKGMSPEVKERIFEPFFTTKGVGKGTGLGLAVVHGIMRQSGGVIEVESVIDQGTLIRVYLPIACGPEQPLPEPRTIVAVRGHETILLVEDEASLREVTARSLEEYGYTVLKAASPIEAIATMKRRGGSVDLLLTDVVMPGLSGRQLAERLAADHPRLPVLFTSGYTDDAVVRYGVREAEVAFLPKPFTPLALATRVREVLDSQARVASLRSPRVESRPAAAMNLAP
jgi:PAS domain S-box-containing protein